MNIPRKLSIDDAEKDARLMAVAMALDVFLDGQKQTACLRYDLDAGEIERIAQDNAGKIIIEGGDFKREIVRGVVEVRKTTSA